MAVDGSETKTFLVPLLPSIEVETYERKRTEAKAYGTTEEVQVPTFVRK
jgi:hypothetical protein